MRLSIKKEKGGLTFTDVDAADRRSFLSQRVGVAVVVAILVDVLELAGGVARRVDRRVVAPLAPELPAAAVETNARQVRVHRIANLGFGKRAKKKNNT